MCDCIQFRALYLFMLITSVDYRGGKDCVSLCVFLMQNFGKSLRQFIVIKNSALLSARVWSIVKPIQVQPMRVSALRTFYSVY